MKRFLLTLLLAASATAAEPRATLTILQWNVENLFDTHDDPATEGDDEFTPAGSGAWTEARYARKLAHLAEIVAGTDADIVCVQEVENRRVLEDLAAVLRERHGRDYPFIVHRNGTDTRSIDVALMANLAPVTNRWVTPEIGQRDILISQFMTNGVPLTVLVNHWKSWRGPRQETAATRMVEAKAARVEVDRVTAASPDASVVVVGDFNDTCDGPSLRDGLRSTLDLNKVLQDAEGDWLYNLHGLLPRNRRGTIYHARGGRWQSFDSMSVSRAMVDRSVTNMAVWRVARDGYGIVSQPQQLDEQGRPKPFRRVQGGDGEMVTGYSDHLPVRVVLELR